MNKYLFTHLFFIYTLPRRLDQKEAASKMKTFTDHNESLISFVQLPNETNMAGFSLALTSHHWQKLKKKKKQNFNKWKVYLQLVSQVKNNAGIWSRDLHLGNATS